MRIVFLGTPALAVATLAALAAEHDVVAVVCQPDKPQGRSGAAVPPPTKQWAQAHGVPVHQPVKLNDGAFEAWLRHLSPDVGIIFAYGRLLKQPILDAPPLGWLNVHPSLLPRWRGPSPIQSTILHGDTETGVSIMRVSLAMDAGDLLLQERLEIGPQENAEALSDRIAPLCARMMCTALAQVAAGAARCFPQDDTAATYCTLLTKEHGYIHWGRSAHEIHNQVRACVPWPAAQCSFRGGVCKVLGSVVVPGENTAPPGNIVAIEKNHVAVSTGCGLLGITLFQAPGKKPMPMTDFARGARLHVGETLGELAGCP